MYDTLAGSHKDSQSTNKICWHFPTFDLEPVDFWDGDNLGARARAQTFRTDWLNQSELSAGIR